MTARSILPAITLALALAACGGPAHRASWVAGRREAGPARLPTDPDEAFAALQRRLLAARSIDLGVQIESGAPVPSLLTGTVELRAGNQVALSIDGQLNGEAVHLRLASAGGRLTGGPHGDGDAVIDLATPPALHQSIVVGMLGMGLLHNLAMISSGMPPDHAAGGVEAWMVTSNHVWDTGRDATFDGRPTRALSFDIAVEGEDVADATLWLDAETGLPVKREVTVRFDAGTMHVVETYLKFVVRP